MNDRKGVVKNNDKEVVSNNDNQVVRNVSNNDRKVVFGKKKFPNKTDGVERNTEVVSFLLERRFVVTVKSGGKSRKTAVVFGVVVHHSEFKKSIGVGTASAKSFFDAKMQAIKDAKKSLITLKMNKKHTLYEDLSASHHGTSVKLFHSKLGIKAPPSVRSMFKNLKLDATCKVVTGSKNVLNISKAVIAALRKHETIFDIAERCGKSYDEIVNRKMCVSGRVLSANVVEGSVENKERCENGK